MHRIDITLELQARAPLHVGTGLGFGGVIDDTVAKRAGASQNEHVYIPGSSLKGRLRYHFRQAARLVSEEALHSDDTRCRTTPCVECVLFGSEWHQAAFRYSDAKLTDEWLQMPSDVLSEEQTSLRTGIRLSRRRGVVLERHLYTIEAATEVLAFQTTITGWLEPENGSIVNRADVKWLLLATQQLTMVGGFKTAGLGRVKTQVKDVREVDGDGNVIQHPLLDPQTQQFNGALVERHIRTLISSQEAGS